MSFYAIDPDLTRLLLAQRGRPVAAEATRPLPGADADQGPLAALVLTFGALSVLSAVVPWP